MKSSNQSILFLLAVSALLSSCAVRRSGSANDPVVIQKKYSEQLGVDRKDIINVKLYSFIDDWYGVQYRYAGRTKKGVDCSGFASVLFKEIFDKTLTGSSASIYNQCEKINKEDLKEGDLIFFKIESKEVSHVGIYLQNNKFVHASSKAGVTIAQMTDVYYQKYFEGAGRVK